MSSAERFKSHHLVEKLGGFDRGETQVGGAQFSELTTDAQASQRERRILTGGDDQMHLRRQVFDEEGQCIVNRFGINYVVVVKDENEIIGDGSNFIEQGCQNRFDRRWLMGLNCIQHPCSNIFRNLL